MHAALSYQISSYDEGIAGKERTVGRKKKVSEEQACAEPSCQATDAECSEEAAKDAREGTQEEEINRVCEGAEDKGGEGVEESISEESDQTSDEEQAEGEEELCHNLAIAKRGEYAAARYLESLNYDIIERNWRCPAGEADIIALVDNIIVFVEVKTRSNLDKGFPEEAVTAKKRSRYERIAAYYLKDFNKTDMQVRFDVIALLVISPDRALVKHHINAFGVA